MVVVTMMVMMAMVVMMVMMVIPVMMMCFCSPVFSVLLQHVKKPFGRQQSPKRWSFLRRLGACRSRPQAVFFLSWNRAQPLLDRGTPGGS